MANINVTKLRTLYPRPNPLFVRHPLYKPIFDLVDIDVKMTMEIYLLEGATFMPDIELYLDRNPQICIRSFPTPVDGLMENLWIREDYGGACALVDRAGMDRCNIHRVSWPLVDGKHVYPDADIVWYYSDSDTIIDQKSCYIGPVMSKGKKTLLILEATSVCSRHFTHPAPARYWRLIKGGDK